MKKIGGNITCFLKERTLTKNEIGENVSTLTDYISLFGWLDFMTHVTERDNVKSKMVEATNIFLCDYVYIEKSERDLVFVDDKGKEYDILYIDDPMNLKYHLEIYLKYLGD
jgi:hypothetical protein